MQPAFSTCSQVMGALDLLLRWCVLRIVEANTQSLVRTLDFLKVVDTCVDRKGNGMCGQGRGTACVDRGGEWHVWTGEDMAYQVQTV